MLKKIFLLLITLILTFSLPTITLARSTSNFIQLNPMADVDRDGVVTTYDLDKYVEIKAEVDNGNWSNLYWVADLNHDEQINIQDAAIIGSHYQLEISNCHWADTNGNGVVTMRDLQAFGDAWGEVNHITNRFDINADGIVNIQDLSIASTEYSNTCN